MTTTWGKEPRAMWARVARTMDFRRSLLNRFSSGSASPSSMAGSNAMNSSTRSILIFSPSSCTLCDALLFTVLSSLRSSSLLLRSAHALPAAPPHKRNAIYPAESLPQPSPFLSTSWRAKKDTMRRTVSEDKFLRFLMSRARATPTSVPPRPCFSRSVSPRSALAAISSVGFKSMSLTQLPTGR